MKKIVLIIITVILIAGAATGVILYKKGKSSPEYSQAKQIPDGIISATHKGDHSADILFAKKKVIYYIKLEGCNGAARMDATMKNIVNELSVSEKSAYLLMPETVKPVSHIYCKDIKNCFQMYLYENCSGGFCIINPKKKQLILVKEIEPARIKSALEYYKSW